MENGCDFAVNHPQLTQFCRSDARRAKVGDKDIGPVRLGRLPANGGKDQVAGLRPIARHIQRPPRRGAMKAAQRLAGAMAQFVHSSGGFILQPAGFRLQPIPGIRRMGVLRIALLQGDNLHVIPHIDKRGDLVQHKGFRRQRKFQ